MRGRRPVNERAGGEGSRREGLTCEGEGEGLRTPRWEGRPAGRGSRLRGRLLCPKDVACSPKRGVFNPSEARRRWRQRTWAAGEGQDDQGRRRDGLPAPRVKTRGSGAKRQASLRDGGLSRYKSPS